MKGSFSAETLTFVEGILEFRRCERSDGSFYGTGGQCRKGVEAADKEKRPLSEAVVQGRFNLSHAGHAVFIKKVLEKADKVNVVVSTKEGEKPGGKDGKAGNLDWNFRVLMLRTALRSEGADVDRVKFVKGESPEEVIKEMLRRNKPSEVGVFLGKDKINGEFAKRLADRYGIHGGLIESDSGKGSISSTQIRSAIDNNDYQLLRTLLGNNPYMERLATAGRQMELM